MPTPCIVTRNENGTINQSTGIYWYSIQATSGNTREYMSFQTQPIALEHFWKMYVATFDLQIPANGGVPVIQRNADQTSIIRLYWKVPESDLLPGENDTYSLQVFPLTEDTWMEFKAGLELEGIAWNPNSVASITAETAARCDSESADEDESDDESDNHEGEVECSDCGNWTDEDESYRTANGETICQDCYDHSYYRCERCEDVIHTDDSLSVITGYNYHPRRTAVTEIWCETCHENRGFRCCDCSEYFSDDVDSTNVDGDIYCQRCFENSDIRSCDSCGCWIGSGDSRWCEHCEVDVCASCYRSEHRNCGHDEDEAINSYNYKPRPNFFGKSSEIHYGVELEVSTSCRNAGDVLDTIGSDHVYLKSDSSIDGNGFEIVTHPHTLSAHRETWEGFFGLAGRLGMSAIRNGMHVHIERSKLSRMQIQKMQAFLNLEANFDFVKTIAMRDPSEWARCCKELGKVSARGNGSRYSALNLCNEHTVEVRIFRGTVVRETFLKNLEFCDALVRFTRDRSYQDLNATAFKDFVRQNRKEYINLDNFLVRKGEMKPASKPNAKSAVSTSSVPVGELVEA